MNDESEDKWLPLKRAADQKALILAAVSAIIFVAGISGSGIFRWGKFDTDDASVLKASVIRYMDLNFVRKEEYREKHNVMKSRMNATENDDEKLFLDIRSLYTLVATVDPRKDVNTGSDIDLVMDMSAAHIFDKDTERAIR